MAAEFTFFGENSNGVGGDLQSTSWIASDMVGASGMSPLPIDLKGKTFADENEEQTRERVLARLEDIGVRLLNTGSIGDHRKQVYAAQIVGQAFVTAYNLIRINREKIENIADAVVDGRRRSTATTSSGCSTLRTSRSRISTGRPRRPGRRSWSTRSAAS